MLKASYHGKILLNKQTEIIAGNSFGTIFVNSISSWRLSRMGMKIQVLENKSLSLFFDYICKHITQMVNLTVLFELYENGIYNDIWSTYLKVKMQNNDHFSIARLKVKNKINQPAQYVIHEYAPGMIWKNKKVK